MSGEGFANPIIGGDGALIREAVISPDWNGDAADPETTPGDDGWGIFRSGLAIFNDVLIRGTFETAGSGLRTQLIPGTYEINSIDWTGLRFFHVAEGDTDDPGFLGATNTLGLDLVRLSGATTTGTNRTAASLTLRTPIADSTTGDATLIAEEFDIIGDFRISGDLHGEWAFVGHDTNPDPGAALVRVENQASGNADMDDQDTRTGVFLFANGMNSTSRYTPAVVFGSSDSAFTTQNPKPLAAIVGRARETFAADNDGAMSLEFFISDANPGTSDVLGAEDGFTMRNSGFRPMQDNAMDLGGSSQRWDDVFATNGTIQTSDLREKHVLEGAALGSEFMLALEGIAFLRHGGSRTHHGVGAQHVTAALEALGLDPAGHALWVADPETGRLGVRYDELWGPQVNTNREFADRLTKLETAVLGR